MAKKGASRDIGSREQWAAQIAALDETPRGPRARKEPVTVARVVAAALQVVEADGFDALTMRRVAAVLQVVPGALYAHVRDKAELDDLMIGELCSRVTLPPPDPRQWQAQAVDVCRQLRDQYLRYPGISRAALAAAPHSLDTMRLNEGLLAILMAGGVPLPAAAWVIDAAFQYIGAYSVVSLRRGPGDTSEVVERLRMLPPTRFPITVGHAEELISGQGHERFDFTLGLLFGGLTPATS